MARLTIELENGGVESIDVTLVEGRQVVLPARVIGVRLESETLWAPAVRIEGAGVQDLPIFRAGLLRAELIFPDGEEEEPLSGTMASVALESLPEPEKASTDEVGEFRLECPIADRKIECPVPAVLAHLRLEVPGFAPAFFWHRPLSGSGPADLGRVRLRRGSSIYGWVVADGSLDDRSPAELQLRSRSARPDSALAEDRLAIRGFRTSADRRGFFLFDGLPAGEYVLEATLGSLSAREPDLILGAETHLGLEQPLVLRPRVRLRTVVNPPQDPYGKPWSFTLQRRAAAGTGVWTTVSAGDTDREGSWKSDPLAEGSYEISLRDSRGSRWSSRSVFLEADSPILYFEPDLVPIRGEVSRGGEPVEATIWFGGRYRSPSIRLKTTEEGSFEGALPHEGTWQLDLSTGHGKSVPVAPIDVELSAGARVARIAIELPETRVFGSVVDAEGAAVPWAPVRFVGVPVEGSKTPARKSSVEADDQGNFVLEGFPPGRVEISARHPRTRVQSQARTLELAERVEEGPVSLVVGESTEKRGRVLVAGQPVAGALVLAEIASADGGVSSTAQARWDLRRVEFVLPIPAGSPWADLLVVAPGAAARMVRTHWDDRQLHDVTLTEEGGILELEIPQVANPTPLHLQRVRGLVLVNGQSDFAVEQLANGLGAELARPSVLRVATPLESGPYRLCSADRSECTAGVLAPGGTLELSARDLPSMAELFTAHEESER